jgi:hypothetical protein
MKTKTLKARLIKLITLPLLGFYFGISLGPADAQVVPTETEVRSAIELSAKTDRLNLPQFKTLFDWITETTGKEKWRQIQWRHDLWNARIESAKVGKPIFLWAMNGDPLGCV